SSSAVFICGSFDVPSLEVAVDVAGVDTPVVVANAVSASCERRNCPTPCTALFANGKTFSIMLDVVVPCLVVVAGGELVAVEVAEVVVGIRSSRICTMSGGGNVSTVLVDSCACVEVPSCACVESAGLEVDAGGVGGGVGAGGGVS